jgi:Taurine catabolism dioxygenase TauD, TfdA family
VNKPSPVESATQGSPFQPDNAAAYRHWREQKLADYPTRASELVVAVCDPRSLADAERQQLLKVLRKTNMVVYATALGATEDKDIPRKLGEQFGLVSLDANMLADEDAITSLQVVPEKSGRGYIPYSNRRLLWHTDGYYNEPSRQIRGMVLHCVRPAAEGGESGLLDQEIAYIHLRDANPDYIRVLMQPDAMTIPANTESGERGTAVSGPVFSIEPATGALHMRYTARTRSISWKDDALTRAAVQKLEQILAGESPYVIHHRLDAGQGLLCNNVLHNRTAFSDADGSPPRLLYRARYYERIGGTALSDFWSGK